MRRAPHDPGQHSDPDKDASARWWHPCLGRVVDACRSVRTCRKAAAALEFGLVASGLITFMMVIIAAGLLVWGIGTLYSVAAQAARCGAIGVVGTPPCTTEANTKTFAVSTAGNWLFPNVIATTDVTTTVSTTTCRGVAGKFYKVDIATTRMQSLPAPLHNITINVSACYPRS